MWFDELLNVASMDPWMKFPMDVLIFGSLILDGCKHVSGNSMMMSYLDVFGNMWMMLRCDSGWIDS